VTYFETHKYRGYLIRFCEFAPDCMAWNYVHQDDEGEEGGRHGCGASVDECRAEIDDLEYDWDDERAYRLAMEEAG
jgi:hypothetical protein